MDKQKVTQFFKGIQKAASKKSPEILTGIGIAGMITTTVLAVKATPKALELIESAKESKKEDSDDKPGLNAVEVVKVAWKPYIPAAVTGVVSVACLIGASSVNARRNAALATAYQLSANALTEYKEKVVETIGEKKEKGIREKIAQDKVTQNPVSKSEVVITGAGDVLFLEPVSMRYFTSDIEKVRKIINDINYRMTCGMEESISLSEFYDEIGLTHTSNSDEIGWNLYKDGQIRLDFHPTVAEDGKPCLMLEYGVSPRYRYMDAM